jgi:hypothetical protein
MLIRITALCLTLGLCVNGIAKSSTVSPNLFDVALGSAATEQVDQITVARLDPDKDYFLWPIASRVETEAFGWDLLARFRDHTGIKTLLAVLKDTPASNPDTYCNKPDKFEFSWVVYLEHSDPNGGPYSRLSSLYLSPNGLCAWTRGSVYWVGPGGISRYLPRTFGFMNF